ncbi:MAG: hypothetical protein K0Q66_955 [Chitinophagaceae bacterium]|nr:hypothetical protein [Chitinophagaceae bacterium]
MKNVFTFIKPFFLAVLLVAFIGASAWQADPKNEVRQQGDNRDTVKPGKHVPGKNEHRVKDFDQAMKELEEAMRKLEVEMKKVDGAKIEKEIKEAMSKVDMKKIEAEIKAAMEKVDWNKIRVDVDKAMKEAEVEMKKIDFGKIEKEMEQLKLELKEIDLDIKIDAEKIRKEVEEGMKKGKEGKEKAMAEVKLLKEFTDELEKDGLIDKKKGYKVEVKDGELYINGTKQSKETTEKYRKYFKKDNFSISTDGDTIITI